MSKVIKLLWRLIPHSHGTSNVFYVGQLPMNYYGGYEIWECRKCGKVEAA